jgi:hypothetical protein
VVQDEFDTRRAANDHPADEKVDRMQSWLDAHGLYAVDVRELGMTAIAKIRDSTSRRHPARRSASPRAWC